MAVYTGVADGNGDFSVPFSSNYTSGQKITVIAEKDSATKSIELFAPSGFVSNGFIRFSGSLVNFPDNVGIVTISDLISIGAYSFASANSAGFFGKALGLIIEDSVIIGNNAFHNWVGAKSISLPDTLVTVGDTAFQGWTSAGSLIIPNSVEAIGVNAFRSWTAATHLTIGSGVKSIAAYAFNTWNSCDEIICLATTPPSITSNTFGSLKSTCIIKVPSASVAAYQAAPNWSVFAARIQAI